MESIKLPLKLAGGITLTDFGTVKPEYITETTLPLIGYTTEWVDSKGIKFISTIVDNVGPYYSVRAIVDKPTPSPGVDESTAKAPTEPVEVGSGLSPDAAWQAAAERQQEVTDLASIHKQEGSSHADEMEPGDSLLLRAAPLTGYWGTERFGLIDISCLQALEGQPGVEETNYKYVEERSSWDEVNRRLGREAAHHGKALATGSGPSRPRADRRPKSQGERDKAAVARVVENMVRQLEAMEAKNAAAEQRAMAKKEREVQRQLEKEERRLAKEREREISRQLHEQRRALERAAHAEAARRAAEAARTFPDEDLAETATVPPPKPLPLVTGRLPAAMEPVLLEAWHLLNRFKDTLGINSEDIPSLSKLETSLLEGPASRGNRKKETATATASVEDGQEELEEEEDAAVWVASHLVDLLIKDLFTKSATAIAEASADVPEKDLRPSTKAPHPVPIGPDTWQEAARRYLSIVADAAACQAKLGEDGLPYPADHFEDFLIIQYLLAGPPTALARGWGALPAKGTSEHAWLGAVATSDAEAVAAAGLPEGSVTNRDQAVVELTIRVQRCILRELANIKGKNGRSGRVLCFQGHGAGAATKMGRSLDLRYVGARVDTGFYAAAQDPMAAFKADVDFVTDLHQQANNKKYSGFHEVNKEKGVAEVAAMVSSKLDAALAEIQQVGAEAYLAQHSPPVARPGSNAEGEDAMEVDNLANEDPPESDPVRDLKRPFAPWEGCCVCWDDTDDERQLLCAMCSAPYHTYCLNPPLDDVPEDEWICPGCAQGAPKVSPPKFPAGSGAAAVWEMAQLLGSKDYAEWTVDKRASLLSMLCMLVEDSPALRELLIGEENAQRDMRKELFAKRNELKQKQQEEAAERNPQDASGPAPAAGGEGAAAVTEAPAPAPTAAEQQRMTSRRARDIAAEIEAIVQRISQLEHDVDQFQHPRLESLGMDRHYNRYWFLPSAALSGDPFGPGAVVIERYHTDTSITNKDRPGTAASVLSPADGEWQVGLYKGIDSVTNLINWLNTKGVREKALEAELRTVRTRLNVQAQEAQRMEEEAKLDAKVKRAEEQVAAGVKRSESRGAGEVAEAMDVDTNNGAPEGDSTDNKLKNLSPTERLRSALLDFEAGLAPAARHPLHGRPEAMEAWRSRIATAQTPQEFMRGLIALEQGINSSYLKTHWRPWAMAAPHPNSAGTLATVWLRLEALRGAIRMKVMLKFNRDLGGLGGASNAGGLRPRREATKRLADSAPDSGIDSDAEGSAGENNNKESRAERAAKRAKAEAAGAGGSDMEGLDDEEMARRLHAELNAVGGRASRLRHGSGAGLVEETKGRGSGGGGKTYKEPSDEIEEEEEEEEDEHAANNNKEEEKDAYEPGDE
jgi:Williams-Beuren syndrome DDT (WSD), D-TOX E motif/PHD-finger